MGRRPHAAALHSLRIGDDMRRPWMTCLGWLCAACWTAEATAQTPLTWGEVRVRFEATNPTLDADRIGIDESKANEITAFLRPNPQLSMTADQIGHNDQGRPFADMITVFSVGYLHERQHKRELRRESAEKATA